MQPFNRDIKIKSGNSQDQKDERALPGNLQNRKEKIPPSPLK
jgi:hypothetical protein